MKINISGCIINRYSRTFVFSMKTAELFNVIHILKLGLYPFNILEGSINLTCRHSAVSTTII